MCERIRQGRRFTCRTRNGRNKTVAAARYIAHISAARLPLPECLAQRRDMIAKAALIDHKVWPHSRDQFLLANYFGRTFDESEKNVESAAAKLNRLATFL